MKLNKKIALAFPAAALAVMGGASSAAADIPQEESFEINALNCLAFDVLQAPILSDDDNTVDCSTEVEKHRKHTQYNKILLPPTRG